MSNHRRRQRRRRRLLNGRSLAAYPPLLTILQCFLLLVLISSSRIADRMPLSDYEVVVENIVDREESGKDTTPMVDSIMNNPRRGGMRRHMLDPLSPLPSHRFISYMHHPYERRLPREDANSSEVIEEINVPIDTVLVSSDENVTSLDSPNKINVAADSPNDSPTIPETRKDSDSEVTKSNMNTASEDDIEDAQSIATIVSAGASSSDLFAPMRIHLETTELISWGRSSTAATKAKVKYIVEKVLPAMVQLWSSALSVVPVSGKLKPNSEWCPYGTDTLSGVFTEGVDADLIVFVTVNSEICDRGGVLASAVSCHWDQYQRPTAGNIDFCLGTLTLEPQRKKNGQLIDNPAAEKQKLLDMAIGTAVHEFGHILGITSSDFVFYYDRTTGQPRTPVPKERLVKCVNGPEKRMFMPSEDTIRPRNSDAAGMFYEIVTPTVTQVARNQFNCQEITGVRLENQPTADDCFGSHFDERLYFTENMSPVLGGVPEVLSSLTLALLQDTGWYKPDYSKAGVSPFGHGAGCEFVRGRCIDNRGEVPAYGRGYFCKDKMDYVAGRFVGRYGCDPTHTHLAMCDLVDYGILKQFEPPPSQFQYFDNKKLGALMETTDFCPTFSVDSISCHNVASTRRLPPLKNVRGESYGPQARCFITDAARPICLDVECNQREYNVVVRTAPDPSGNRATFICTEDFQTFELPGVKVVDGIIMDAKEGSGIRFECPRLASVCPEIVCPANCAGHGMCDYKIKNPECRCFNKEDKSQGCTDLIEHIPPKTPWDHSSARVQKGSLFFGIITSCILWVLWDLDFVII